LRPRADRGEAGRPEREAGDVDGSHEGRPIARQTLLPPNANALASTRSMRRVTASLATFTRTAGSISLAPRLAGARPARIACAANTALVAPAAPSWCPVNAFVETTGTSVPSAASIAALS